MNVKKVAVIGSGLMGSGIAQVAAMSGQEVNLVDISAEQLAQALNRIALSLDKFVEKGKIRDKNEVLKRITTCAKLETGVSDADFIIEAVPEEIDLKRKIFSIIDIHAPEHAILATNTSGLPISIIAEATRNKKRVIGMHWMNPPQLMRLVEIIKSKYTDEETLKNTIELCRNYGKETVIAQRDVWFFLSVRSRAGLSIESGMMYLRKEADIREIDAISRYKMGLPMGAFELTDFTGFVDVVSGGLKSAEKILKSYPDFEPWPAFLEAYRHLVKELWGPMSQKGLSGVKTGQGFYTYPGKKYVKPVIPEELAAKVDPMQLLAPTINVAAWCVSNGIGSIADINKSLRLGFGWPKGIFDFIDEYGVNNIIGVLQAKQGKASGWQRDFYRPDPLLVNWSSGKAS